jgi:hypothetical protein
LWKRNWLRFCGPFPTISPFSTDQTVESPSQPVRSLPLKSGSCFSDSSEKPSGKFTWVRLLRYARRCRASSLVMLASRPSGIIEISLSFRASMSPFGMIRRSFSVCSVMALLSSDFSRPVTTRSLLVRIVVAW